MNIVQQLTARYGEPRVRTTGGVLRNWVITAPNANISISHGSGTYSSDNGAEVAYVRRHGIAAPSTVTSNQEVLTLFNGDVVAGWCTVDQIAAIVDAAH